MQQAAFIIAIIIESSRNGRGLAWEPMAAPTTRVFLGRKWENGSLTNWAAIFRASRSVTKRLILSPLRRSFFSWKLEINRIYTPFSVCPFGAVSQIGGKRMEGKEGG